MARFIVTSGSHFQPFTYNELVEPLMQMTEAQNNAQEAYDHISMETNALENYISQNPEDERARAMYDNYKSKLTALQNNLWNNGYSGQTARDLSAARAGYAGDITRLATAIKNRQERSKEYWDMRHKNPDMVAGNDPGAAGLDNYLDNDRYGQDYFNYSGDKFTTEVATDAKAIAGAKLESEIVKDPKLKGYLERIKTEGYTMKEADHATSAVEDLLFNGNSAALNNLTYPERLLAETLVSHMNSTGAERYTYDDDGNVIGGNLSEEEYRRLFEYGKAGAKHAVGKTSIDDIKDQEYAYKQEINKINYQHTLDKQEKDEEFKQKLALEAMKGGNPSLAASILGGNFSGSGLDSYGYVSKNDTDTTSVTGNREKAEKKVKSLFGEDTLKFTKGGKEVHNGADASDLVYDYNTRQIAYENLGFDIGRDPKSNPNDIVRGTVERGDITYETQLIPIGKGQCVVQKRVAGKYTNPKDGWKNDDNMTNFYNRARKKYEETLDYYKNNEPEIYALASVNPDKMYDLYEKEGFSFGDTPLSKFTDRYYAKPENSVSTPVQNTIVARAGTDSGKYIERLGKMLSMEIHSGDGKNRDWKAFDNQSGHMHEYDEGTALPKAKSIKNPGDIFTFDKDGYISNINGITLDENGIRNVKFDSNTGKYVGGGYVVVGTTKNNKKYTIGLDMFHSDDLNGILMEAKQMLEYNDMVNPIGSEEHDNMASAIVSQAVSQIRSSVGYVNNTQSAGGTNKDDNN